MPIYVLTPTGQIKQVSRVYRAVSNGVANVPPKEVLLVRVPRRPPSAPGQLPLPLVLETVHDRYQYPPVGMRLSDLSHTSCTLNWLPSSQGALPAEYQVTYKPRVPGETVYQRAKVLSWTPLLSAPITGLAPDMEYTFTVMARRPAPDGTQITSLTSSAPITLATNHPALLKQNPAWPGDSIIYLPASASDTWTKDWFWGSKSGGPDVIQGYLRTRTLNGSGVVWYKQVRSRANTEIDKIDIAAGDIPVDMTKVVLDDAKIDRIYRRFGGAGRPVIHLFPCKINFSSNDRPVPYGGTTTGTTFTAPAEGGAIDELDPGKLLTWAREWMSTSPDHNGMLIYAAGDDGNATAGYNGYSIFRAAKASAATSDPTDWRLKLWVKWSYTLPDVPAAVIKASP